MFRHVARDSEPAQTIRNLGRIIFPDRVVIVPDTRYDIAACESRKRIRNGPLVWAKTGSGLLRSLCHQFAGSMVPS